MPEKIFKTSFRCLQIAWRYLKDVCKTYFVTKLNIFKTTELDFFRSSLRNLRMVQMNRSIFTKHLEGKNLV